MHISHDMMQPLPKGFKIPDYVFFHMFRSCAKVLAPLQPRAAEWSALFHADGRIFLRLAFDVGPAGIVYSTFMLSDFELRQYAGEYICVHN
jgi:hypothetical protein